MSGRGGRDRSQRDYPPRSEERERNRHSRSNAPPSRHLWVGNLSHNLSERNLTDHFLRFGELESVAFQPGRSYAFINFKHNEEAFAAVRALQGFFVAGNPLKIEFAKADKSSASSADEEYLPRRDDQRSTVRGSPYPHREPRAHRSSPDSSYSNKSKMDNKNVEPSEVLWIGFPALLKVDETILRKAFSPFGEIVKITAFPGRSYAFVRYRNVMSASRAKDTLHGKLFGNPRVHICFARSESSGKNPMNAPSSPDFRSYERIGASENFLHDRSYDNLSGDPNMRSPRFISDMESRDPDIMPLQRKGNVWPSSNGAFEQGRIQDLGPELGPPRSVYEHRASPPRDVAVRFRDFSPQKFPRQGQLYDDAWDLPEDVMLFHESKKLKTSFPHENELPEYPPFSDHEQVKHVLPRIPDYPQHDAFDKFDSGSFGREKIPDRANNLIQPYGERNEPWNTPYDNFQAGSVPLPPNHVEWKRTTPELHQPSDEVWKWEGTIAKGGTPVCRARCFPVGKVLDMILPDFLDCTARTGLDMLAKHYYQSAGAWVVFFVPETDVDIAFYNEFMNYLGEKQRAAVAKIDEKNTLFLVPPSEFSEKVLKVPGKLSISGVILRLETPGPSVESLPNPYVRRETSFGSFQADASYARPMSPSVSYSSVVPFPNHGNHGGNIPFHGKLHTPAPSPSVSYAGSVHGVRSMSNTIDDNRHVHQQSPSVGPNWSGHNLQNPNTGDRNVANQVSTDSINQGYNPAMPRVMPQKSLANHTTGFSGSPSIGSNKPFHDTEPPSSSSLLSAAIQPEQLARLASLLGQQRQTGVVSAGQVFRQSGNNNQLENSYRPQQQNSLSNNQASSDYSSSQFGQQKVEQFQQHQYQHQHQASNVPTVPQRELPPVALANQQPQNTGTESTSTQDEGDADPQKRLQATLQLAAALLQQIQQGKKN